MAIRERTVPGIDASSSGRQKWLPVIRRSLSALGAASVMGVMTWESVQSLALTACAALAGWLIRKWVDGVDKKLARAETLQDEILELRTQYKADRVNEAHQDAVLERLDCIIGMLNGKRKGEKPPLVVLQPREVESE